MMSMNHYLGQISSAWDEYDGETIAKLISFEDPHSMNPRLQVRPEIWQMD